MVITPTKEALERVKQKVKDIVRSENNREARERKLNPLRRGWVNDYANTWTGFQTIQKLNQYRFTRLKKWQRQGKNKGNLKKIFEDVTKGKEKRNGKSKWKWGKIMWPNEVKVKQKRIVKLTINPYLRENEKYVIQRTKVPKSNGYRSKLYEEYNYQCPHCREPLLNGEPVEIHHIVPKKVGVDNRIKNLAPMHRMCHQARTYNQNLTKTNIRPGDGHTSKP